MKKIFSFFLFIFAAICAFGAQLPSESLKRDKTEMVVSICAIDYAPATIEPKRDNSLDKNDILPTVFPSRSTKARIWNRKTA